MNSVLKHEPSAMNLARVQLKHSVEDFLFREADLLDRRQLKQWLDLLTDDLVYFMPIRHNVRFGLHDKEENTRLGAGISWFDEDKWTLTKRVEQILTGVHYAEEPLSRVTHLISNVHVIDAVGSVEAPTQVTARSAFLIYQNRVESETYTFVGRRTDTLRWVDSDWKIAKREILLEQNILQAKNLSVFF